MGKSEFGFEDLGVACHRLSRLRLLSLWSQATSITREGAYYLFVLTFVMTGAVLREINLMLVLAGMMIGPLVYNWLTARKMVRAVRIERILPKTIIAGQPAMVCYRAISSRHCCAISIQDATDRTGQSLATAWFADLPTGRRTMVESQLIFPQRGVYRLGPMTLQTSYPLGLLRATRVDPQVDRLLVLPRLGRLTRQWRMLYDAASHGEVRQRRQGAMQGDFYGLREWRGGDSRRHIHWRTSARRGALMIRQFEQTRNQDLVLLINLWHPIEPTPADRARVEQAVSFAATLISQTCRQGGCQLTVAFFDRSQLPRVIQATASAALGRDLQASLAEVAAHLDPPGQSSNTAGQLFEACSLSPRDATIVLVTTLFAELSNLPSPDRQHSSGRDRRWLTVKAGSKDFDELIEFDR